MKVYAAFSCDEDDWHPIDTLECIFKDKSDAKKFCNKRNNNVCDNYYWEEFEVLKEYITDKNNIVSDEEE